MATSRSEHSDLVSGEIPSRQLLETAASVGRGLQPAQAERLAAALAPLERATEAQHLSGLIPTPAFRQNVQRLLDAWAEQAGPTGITVGAAIAAAAHATKTHGVTPTSNSSSADQQATSSTHAEPSKSYFN